MAFAPTNSDLSYWQKQQKPLFPDLSWNIPEQKTGRITIFGGNSQSFHGVVRIAEYLSHTFPLRSVDLWMPDALRGELPPLPNLSFAPSNTSGSFAKSTELSAAFQTGDFNLIAGDTSRNSATAIAFEEAVKDLTQPLLITRDAVDLLAPSAERLLALPQLFLVASMAQLQKIFRAVYYPRMIMLSQPLLPIVETLHKFTLSYPATILTFHEGQILVANSGRISSTPIASTSYSPISLWSGQLAAKVAALNLYNPNHPFAATTAAVLFE